MQPESGFESAVDRWLGGLGRLRDVVRQEVLAAQLGEIVADLGSPPVRVLDVGCGQGTQALALARAGHRVTGLDPSRRLLEEFERQLAREGPAVRARVRLLQGTGEAAPALTDGGPFDLVLCHGVLMYLDDIAPMLGALSAVAAEGAILSVLVRNGLAPAMRDGLRGDWPAALAAFDRLDYVNRLGISAHAHTPEVVDSHLARIGWVRVRWFGVRVFTDHRDEPAPDPATLRQLLAAERAAGVRDPYRRVAALLHLCYARGPAAGPSSSTARTCISNPER